MQEYKCFTNKGWWRFEAPNDEQAMRLALFYCWRDDEDFRYIEYNRLGEHYVLRINKIDLNNKDSFTLF